MLIKIMINTNLLKDIILTENLKTVFGRFFPDCAVCLLHAHWILLKFVVFAVVIIILVIILLM